MNTICMLMVQYEGRPMIPVEHVRRDLFSVYSAETFLRKLGNGEIPLPLVRLDGS